MMRSSRQMAGIAARVSAGSAAALLVVALGVSDAMAQQQQGVSQRSRGTGLSGTGPFDSNWARGGARAEEAARAHRDPARIDRRYSGPCSREALSRDPSRLRDCR
jgi:hypothetical protein